MNLRPTQRALSRGRTSSALKLEGGLFSHEFLTSLQLGEHSKRRGLGRFDYHLLPQERLADAASRAWAENQFRWRAFRKALTGLSDGDHATRLTRERWLLPLFHSLGFGRLQWALAHQIQGRNYAISHLWHHSPIHLLGWSIHLDQRTRGVAGAASASPHGLVQEFLNQSEHHLWGMVSNGRVLRILRDHFSLTRLAFVEFNLETIFDEEQFETFYLLWLMCHQSRIEAETPEDSWLERWHQESSGAGVRALDDLRGGFKRAVEIWGTGFLNHSGNILLRQDIRSGRIELREFYAELLRCAYRLVYLSVAEDRVSAKGIPLLFRDTSIEAERYIRFYGVRLLRERSLEHPSGGSHRDVWILVRRLFQWMFTGATELGIEAHETSLWVDPKLAILDGLDLSNGEFLSGLRQMSFVFRDQSLHAIDWRLTGAEELGSVYETLLQYQPRCHETPTGWEFRLVHTSGNDRKQTGSYYTPASLVELTCRSALMPLVDAALKSKNPEEDLLAIKVCDPACGSGHFLLGAARFLGHHLAKHRSGGVEPSPQEVRGAVCDVVAHSIYGVDLNPMAVEICRLSLWMECISGESNDLNLDDKIVQGNALEGGVDHRQVKIGSFDWVQQFSNVFSTGGFDAVIGNPPWERVSFDHREFFSAHAPEILHHPEYNTRGKREQALAEMFPHLFELYEVESAKVDALRSHISNDAYFPITAQAGYHTALAFAERAMMLLNPRGRLGLILPSNVGFDRSRLPLLQKLLKEKQVDVIFDFENRKPFFREVDSRARFLVLVASKASRETDARVGFGLTELSQLAITDRTFRVDEVTLSRLGRGTVSLVASKSRIEFELMQRLHSSFGSLGPGAESDTARGTWLRGFVVGESSEYNKKRCRSFKSQSDLDQRLPLFEGKMFHQYDHRYAGIIMNYSNAKRPAQQKRATAEQKKATLFAPSPGKTVEIPGRDIPPWTMVYKDVSQSTNERTLLACILPRCLTDGGVYRFQFNANVSNLQKLVVLSGLNSFVFDYMIRQKIVGNHVPRHIVLGLPFPDPKQIATTLKSLNLDGLSWIGSKVVELSYTSESLGEFARAMGSSQRPFTWDEVRRRYLRAELDAFWFHAYGLNREEIDLVLGDFKLVSKRDVASFGVEETKRLIVEAYRRLREGR